MPDIDKTTFSYWMGVIADRTGRVLAEPTYREYYRALGEWLDTKQFERAARAVFRQAKFWPAPQEFIDAILPNYEAEALSAFDAISGSIGHPGVAGRYWVASEIEAELGAAALVAFRAVGGADCFRYLNPTSISYIRGDFVRAYVAARKAQEPSKQLAPGGHARMLLGSGEVVDTWGGAKTDNIPLDAPRISGV